MKLLLTLFKGLNLFVIASTLLAYLAPHISPAEFYPLIFFGLAYPLLLLGNICFILFWLLLKQRWFWLSAIALLFGGGHIVTLIGFNFSQNNSEDSWSVMSFNTNNLYSFKSKGKEGEDFFNFLKKEKLELACFQEMPTSLNKSNLKEPPFYFQNNHWHKNALLIGTDFEIVSRGTFDFKMPANGASWADVKIHGRIVRVYTVHLKSNQISGLTNNFAFKEDFLSEKGKSYLNRVLRLYKRAAENRAEMVDEISTHVAKSPHPVIFCGDLNDPPLSYTYQKLSEGLKDSFVERGFGWGKTYNGKIPGLRIDYIFVSPELEIVDFRIIKEEISDHFPLVCTLKWREK